MYTVYKYSRRHLQNIHLVTAAVYMSVNMTKLGISTAVFLPTHSPYYLRHFCRKTTWSWHLLLNVMCQQFSMMSSRTLKCGFKMSTKNKIQSHLRPAMRFLPVTLKVSGLDTNFVITF